MLLTLQDQEARCLDAERLLAIAFDTRAFVGRFRRAKLTTLRAKHMAKLEAELGEHHAAATAPARGHTPVGRALSVVWPISGRSGGRAYGVVGVAEPEAAAGEYQDDSSSVDTEDPASDVPFEVLSHDDCATSSPR